MVVEVRGLYHHKENGWIGRLRCGTHLEVRRDSNAASPVAVAVLLAGLPIGHVEERHAERVTDLLDENRIAGVVAVHDVECLVGRMWQLGLSEVQHFGPNFSFGEVQGYQQ